MNLVAFILAAAYCPGLVLSSKDVKETVSLCEKDESPDYHTRNDDHIPILGQAKIIELQSPARSPITGGIVQPKPPKRRDFSTYITSGRIFVLGVGCTVVKSAVLGSTIGVLATSGCDLSLPSKDCTEVSWTEPVYGLLMLPLFLATLCDAYLLMDYRLRGIEAAYGVLAAGKMILSFGTLLASLLMSHSVSLESALISSAFLIVLLTMCTGLQAVLLRKAQ